MDVYWFEQTESDVPQHDDWLTAREIARLAAMRFDKRRRDFRLGRWTAKRTVAESLHQSSGAAILRRIEIASASSGAPEVISDGQHLSITISLTHRGGTAACAIAHEVVRLGCDLEIVEPRSEAFARDYFTPNEEDQLARVSVEMQPLMLALLWSGKESALKALGVGLRADTRDVSVSGIEACELGRESGACWRELQVQSADCLFRGWWQTEQGLVRTIVCELPFAVHPMR